MQKKNQSKRTNIVELKVQKIANRKKMNIQIENPKK
jgi:hypothetical protein